MLFYSYYGDVILLHINDDIKILFYIPRKNRTVRMGRTIDSTSRQYYINTYLIL